MLSKNLIKFYPYFEFSLHNKRVEHINKTILNQYNPFKLFLKLL